MNLKFPNIFNLKYCFKLTKTNERVKVVSPYSLFKNLDDSTTHNLMNVRGAAMNQGQPITQMKVCTLLIW